MNDILQFISLLYVFLNLLQPWESKERTVLDLEAHILKLEWYREDPRVLCARRTCKFVTHSVFFKQAYEKMFNIVPHETIAN